MSSLISFWVNKKTVTRCVFIMMMGRKKHHLYWRLSWAESESWIIFWRLRIEVSCRASHGPITFRFYHVTLIKWRGPIRFHITDFISKRRVFACVAFLIAMMMMMIGSNRAFLMSSAAAVAAMHTLKGELFNPKPNSMIGKKRDNRASVSYDAPKRKLPVLLFDVMDTIVRDPFYQDIPTFFGFDSNPIILLLCSSTNRLILLKFTQNADEGATRVQASNRLDRIRKGLDWWGWASKKVLHRWEGLWFGRWDS